MATKAQMYAQMADHAAVQLTSSWNEWMRFLDTASRLYKYPFHDQLMIYAQRPDATACAEYDLWNDKMGRYVRRGSKGIALVDDSGDRTRLRYVFDISDTGTREHSRTPWLWKMEERHIDSISAMLENRYGVGGDDLGGQLTEIARRLAGEYWADNGRDFLYIVDDSFLEEYDELNIEVQFKAAATVSIAYSLMSRCGLAPEQYFTHEDFMPVFDFNTPATVGALGTAVSQINQQVLRQIGVTILNAERQAAQERRTEHEEQSDLQPERGLSDSRPATDRTARNAPGQVRQDAENLLEGTPAHPLQPSADEREAVPAPVGDRPDREQPVGAADAGIGAGGGRDGGTESPRHDAVGGPDEQLQGPGGGDSAGGTYQQLTLNLFLSEAEQIQNIDEAENVKASSAFSFAQKDIDHTEPPQPALEELLEQYKPVVTAAIMEDTAYRNACGHTDHENAVIEGNAAVRRAVLDSGNIQLIKQYSDVPDFRHRLHQEVVDETYPQLHELLRPLSQDDIDEALRAWNGDMDSKRAVVRYMENHARDKDTAAWLSQEYGGPENKNLFVVRAGSPETIELPWPKVQRRIAQLIKEDRFFTEAERDNLDDIDPIAIRENLAQRGIVNGQVVEPEKLDNDPFIQQVMADVEQIAAEEAEPRFSVVMTSDAFTVYEDIRQKLIAQGMPASQIAFIHEANTEVRKKELFSKVRSGQVRVLLGSTQKMGAGTNVQDLLVALHDLDCPWRPGDLAQRKGRIERQGNQNPLVHVYRYVTEGTFDAYLWQTVENKQKFISQIMTSKSPVRSCDDVDETALSFAEIKALCAGDPRIKERMDLDVEVSRLKLMKADHQSKQYRLEDQLLKHFPEEIEKHKGFIQGLETDMETLAAHPHPTDGFTGMEVRGDTLTDKENAGAALLDACKEVKGSDPVQVGSYRGFAMFVTFDAFQKEYMLQLKGRMTHRTALGADPRGNLTRIDNALSQMPQRLESVKVQLDNLYQQQAAAKEEVGKAFPYEEELRVKNARLVELDMELNMDSKGQSRPEAAIAKRARPSVLEGLKRPIPPRSMEKKPKQQEQEAR